MDMAAQMTKYENIFIAPESRKDLSFFSFSRTVKVGN